MTAPMSAMFQPLMATTWLRPVAVKASVTSRATRSRRPTRIADASPAMGSGTTRATDSSASRRTDSASSSTPPSASTTLSCRTRTVTAASMLVR